MLPQPSQYSTSSGHGNSPNIALIPVITDDFLESSTDYGNNPHIALIPVITDDFLEISTDYGKQTKYCSDSSDY